MYTGSSWLNFVAVVASVATRTAPRRQIRESTMTALHPQRPQPAKVTPGAGAVGLPVVASVTVSGAANGTPTLDTPANETDSGPAGTAGGGDNSD